MAARPAPGAGRLHRQSPRPASTTSVGIVAIGDAALPVPRLGPMAPVRAATGHVAATALYAGQGVGAVREVRPATDVVTELNDEARRLLARAQAPT